MATAPELFSAAPEMTIRPMRAPDVGDVVAIEHTSYQFPWSEGIFRDCLRVGYICRVATVGRVLMGYGVMSTGAGEAHILNVCVGESFRCRGLGRHLMLGAHPTGRRAWRARGVPRGTPFQHRRDPSVPVHGLRAAGDAARLLPGGRWPRGRRGPETYREWTRCRARRRSRLRAVNDMSAATAAEIRRRRTFAIISHPDAGKTTLTEKLLLFGGAIQMAGTVKGRKAARHATSDWMRLEQQRGISVTSSVMQFPYRDCIVNLLDTPGHEDFSEDTYRTLTAVDSALMVIDCAKGVEERTIKLMEVCRLRDTPIMTFINKLDRDGRTPVELLDEIESVLQHPHRTHHLADWHGPGAARHLSPRRGSHLRLRRR